MKQLVFLLMIFCSGIARAQTETNLPESEKNQMEFDEPAEFPSGVSAMKKFLAETIHYPKESLKIKSDGKCYVAFVITSEGKVTDVTVLRGIPECPACDLEAVRVVQLMPVWKPAKKAGVPVESVFKMPILFKLQ